MAVCAVFLIATGIAIAMLFRGSRSIPRHVFIFDIIAELSRTEVKSESTPKLTIASAA